MLAFSSAEAAFVGAFLFGDQMLTLLYEIGSGQVIELNVPMGGIFAPASAVSVTWPAYSYVDEITGAEYKLDAADIEFAGTKFGAAFWKVFGF